MASLINVRDEGPVRFLTLSRPQQLNALNSVVLGELASELDRVQNDQHIRCVVIRGEGDRAFSAGADLDEIRALSVEDAHDFIRRGHHAISTIEQSAVPVIAAVDGFALGGGFELMLACHVVIASTRSEFGLPETRIGCIPGFGGTQRLGQAVGKPAAYHLMLTGTRIPADRAWEIGLLSVPPLDVEVFEQEIAATASLIASGSRGGLENLMEAARRAFEPAALEHEALLAAKSIASADGQEGITSFAERRAPKFKEEG